VRVSPARLNVRLHLLGPSEGGRQSGVHSGYKCQWRSAAKPEWNDAMWEIDAPIEPGDSTEGWLILSVPSFWSGVVAAGDVLEGAEGPRVVARAEVLTVEGA
jgi:hypothetical protein